MAPPISVVVDPGTGRGDGPGNEIVAPPGRVTTPPPGRIVVSGPRTYAVTDDCPFVEMTVGWKGKVLPDIMTEMSGPGNPGISSAGIGGMEMIAPSARVTGSRPGSIVVPGPRMYAVVEGFISVETTVGWRVTTLPDSVKSTSGPAVPGLGPSPGGVGAREIVAPPASEMASPPGMSVLPEPKTYAVAEGLPLVETMVGRASIVLPDSVTVTSDPTAPNVEGRDTVAPPPNVTTPLLGRSVVPASATNAVAEGFPLVEITVGVITTMLSGRVMEMSDGGGGAGGGEPLTCAGEFDCGWLWT